MQRAEKNIDELVENLNQTFRRQRQTSIDEELFEVVSGFEALKRKGEMMRFGLAVDHGGFALKMAMAEGGTTSSG